MTNIEKVLQHHGFRGLWVSKCTEKINGKLVVEEGWSCSFVKDGQYHDLYYKDTPEEACKVALEILGMDNQTNILNSVDISLEKLRNEKKLSFDPRVRKETA